MRPLVLLVLAAPAHGQFSFQRGHYYGAADYYNNSPQTIYEYDAIGQQVGAITLSYAYELHGLAFGPDGLLYAVSERPYPSVGYTVYAIGSNGAVHAAYQSSNGIGGFIGTGKIAFDSAGHFFVASRVGLDRFDTGNPNSGTLIYHEAMDIGVTDVKALPNGNLLVANDSELREITSGGSFVRSYSPGGSNRFYQLRGIEYDPISNLIFTCQLGAGIGNQEHTLAKLNGSTGALISYTTFSYPQDLVLAADGRLVASSWVQPPGIFSRQPLQIGAFGGSDAPFFITYLPEPGMINFAGLVLLSFVLRRRAV